MPLIALIVGVSILLMKEKEYFQKEIKMARKEATKFAEHAVNITDIPEVKLFYGLAQAMAEQWGGMCPPEGEEEDT